MNATKKQFGLHCHLLALNLAKPPSPKPLKPIAPQLPPPNVYPVTPAKGPPVLLNSENGVDHTEPEVLNLSDEDTVNTARFIREFVTQSLVPWMERSVMEWNEIVSQPA